MSRNRVDTSLHGDCGLDRGIGYQLVNASRETECFLQLVPGWKPGTPEMSTKTAVPRRPGAVADFVGPACRAGLRGYAATCDQTRWKEGPRGDVERMCDPWRFALRRKSFPAERTYRTKSFPAEGTYLNVIRDCTQTAEGGTCAICHSIESSPTRGQNFSSAHAEHFGRRAMQVWRPW